jgi:hypothetical protein
VARLRAERDSDADFACSLRHRKSDKGDDSNDREQQPHGAEHEHNDTAELPRGERVSDNLLHRRDTIDRYVPIQRRESGT